MFVSMVVAVVLQQAASAVPPAITIPRVEAEVVIDGRLTEDVWQQATRLGGFRQYQPVDGRPAEEKTEVLVWYAPDAIHFGIVAGDRQPDAVRATQADRDNIEGEDHVIIYLDTFNDRRRAFFFAVNALGVQADGVRTEGAGSAGRMFGNNTDYNPDYIFQSKGMRTDSGYVVEVRIPFKSLRYPANAVQRWGLQFERLTQRTGYTDTWTDVKRASASFLLQAGTVEGLRDLQRGVVMEAQPFLTTTANGDLQPGGEFRRADPNAEIGANLKLSFANAALDATINPDFSQVESDAGQVTLNERFALFFPEKRPFFLEGIELFNTPNQLVYTRQVVEPIAGGKLTGKMGPFSVAHLTALDEDAEVLPTSPGQPGSTRNALFNITRLRTDLGASSTAGLLLSDRSVLESAAYNRVAAADVRVVFARLYFAEAQLGNAWTRGSDGTELRGPLWKLTADRTGRRWGFNYNLNGVSDEFRTRAGFVPRTGVVTGHAMNRISFYGRPGALLESLTTFMGPTRYWRYDEFGRESAVEGGESANTTFRLRGGWNLQGTVGRTFFHFDPALFPYSVQTPQGEQPYQPLERVSGINLQTQLSTPVFRQLDASVTLARSTSPIHAEGADGYTWNSTGSLALRPTRSLRIGWTAGRQQLVRARTEQEFARTLLTRVSTEYQPSRALFFRAVSEYRHERVSALQDARTGAPLLRGGQPIPAEDAGSLRIDLLASFEPSPGTVAFLGYGANLLDDPLIADSWQRQSDGFFLKLAYQIRR